MIKLRELEFEDLKIVNTWRNNKELIDSLGANFRYVNFETEKLWFDSYMKNRNSNVRLAILDSDVFVGMINLTNINMLNQSAEYSIQIGNSEKQSKGVGTKSTKLILEHAFNNLNLNKVYLTVLVKNERAIKLYDKCGFRIEGTLREEVYKNGKFQDMYIMSILKKEFNQQKIEN